MKHFLTNFLRMGSTVSTPPIRSAMRSILLVLGLLLGSLSMWGKTISWNCSQLGSSTITGPISGDIDANISFTSSKGGADNATAYNKDGTIRLYYKNTGNGSDLTLTPDEGVTITEVVLTAKSSYAVDFSYSIDGGAATAGSWSDLSATISDISATSSFKIVNKSTTAQLRLTNITITYSTGGGDIIVKTLKSIAVEGMTTSYEQNDAFSFDGTCKATYSVTVNNVPQEDELKTVTPTSVSTPDMTEAGNKTITVTYVEGEVEKSTTYNITVVAAGGDKLTRETTGVSGTNYTGWSGKSGASGAVYSGNSAGSNESIQLRSNNNNSGVVSTTSGGLIRKVKVAWNSNTASGRTLNVYGSNTAYTAASDLYGDNKGTLLGTIVNGTSTQLEITDDYEYVGVRSNDGAMYLTSITFVWEPGKQLESIAVKNNPNKVSYNIGDAFDAAGLVITATYDDSSKEDIAYAGNEDKFSFTGFSSAAAAAAQAITVTYGGESTTFNVEIKDVTLQTVTVRGTPATTSYTAGDTFDPTDLTVMGHYSDNSDAPITSGITWSYPDANNTLVKDQTSIRVVATVDEIASEAYTVSGLSVTAAPLVASWVASEHYNETTDMTAETVAFGPSNNFSIVFGAGTNTQNAPKYYTSGEAVRAYGGNTFALSSNDYKFKEIVIGFGSSDGSNAISANVGTYEAGTWTGNSKEVVFTIGGTSGQRRIASITVTYEAALPSVETPTFSVAEGTYFETQNVTITTETAGATIYYTTDGAEPTTGSSVYSDPIAVSTGMTIKAIAVKDGMDNSAVASATYAMGPVFTSFEALVAADITSGTKVKVSFEKVAIKKIDTNKKYVTFDIQKEEKDIEIYFNTEALPDTWVVGGTLSGTILAPWKRFAQSNNLVCWELAPESGWQWTNLTYNSPITKEIDHVTVTGTATKTAYVDGEVFDPAGLTVTLYYTDDTNEEVTEGIVWAPTTALTEGTTSVNVTAKVNEVTSAAYPVSITVSEIPTKTIAEFIDAGGGRCYLVGVVGTIANTTYGNFTLTDASGSIYVYGCLNSEGEPKKFAALDVEEGDRIKVIAGQYMNHATQGHEAVDVRFVEELAPEVVAVTGVTVAPTETTIKVGKTVTLAATIEPALATNTNVTWESDATGVATVDESGVVSAVAKGTAIITVTTEDGGFTATCVVTVIDASARAEGNAVFQKVTATEDITNGKYLIVYEDGSVAFDGALETLDAVENTISVTIDNGIIVAPADAAFTIDATAGTLKSYSGKYIGQNSNDNGLATSEEAITNTLSIGGGENADIVSSLAHLRYNSASNQLRFRYYKSASYSGQKAVQLYKMLEPTELRTSLFEGKWGTICPDKKVMLPTGASFYTLTYLQMAGEMPYKLFFDEIETDYLEAGKPYLFIAEGEVIKGVKVGAAVPEAANYNGFYGNVGGSTIQISTSQNAYKADEDVVNYYGLTNNTFTLLANGTNVAHERAVVQIKNGQLDCANPPHSLPAPRAGARRVVAGNNAPAVATGMDELNASETPVKVMIDGQLFILRGEKMYNANGQLVK